MSKNIKRRKNHRIGTCPTCRFLVRVTEDGRCYKHIEKRNYMGPKILPCLGTNRPAEDIMDGEVEDLLKGVQ